MNHLRELDRPGSGRINARTSERTSLGQEAFHRVILLERRRAERSRKHFLLLLLDVTEQTIDRAQAFGLSRKIVSALSPITRDTDAIGWYKEYSVVGLVLTEIPLEDLSSVTAIMNRVSKILKDHLSSQEFSHVRLSFRLLPEAQEGRFTPIGAPSLVYPGVATPGGPESSF